MSHHTQEFISRNRACLLVFIQAVKVDHLLDHALWYLLHSHEGTDHSHDNRGVHGYVATKHNRLMQAPLVELVVLVLIRPRLKQEVERKDKGVLDVIRLLEAIEVSLKVLVSRVVLGCQV